MPVKSLKIKDFQAHSNLQLSFTEGVNIIAGKSDIGKSSIIRALRLALTNQPSGITHFIRNGQKRLFVSVSVNGHRITRIRGKTENTYKVDGVELKAFGKDVPPQVNDAYRLCEDNFQNQHDSSFWLSLPDGQFSRVLNEIISLDETDTVTSNLLSLQRENKTIQTNNEEKQKQHETTLQRGESCENAISFLEEARNLHAKADSIQEATDATETAIEEIGVLLKKKKELSTGFSNVEEADRLAGLIASIDIEIEKERDGLNDIMDILKVAESLDFLSKERNQKQKQLQQLEHEKTEIESEGIVCGECGQSIDRRSTTALHSCK